MSLDAIRVFQVVARAQSFTKAAARLGLDKSQVSRTVRALERDLNVALLARTTRSVRATVEGLALLERVEPLVTGLEQAIAATPERPEVPSGEVVVTATPEVGRALLAPMLVGFRLRFPLVRVRVVLSSSVVNLMTEGVELALRVGRPGGEGLIARKVAELSAGFFAAPAYLERRGTPTRLEQLGRHEGLWPMPGKGQRSFAPGPIASRSAVACADFGLLAELARAGGGVALLPTFLAAREVASGALVRVLPEVSFAGAPLYLVSRPMRPLPPRVAALRGFLLEGFRAL